MLELTKQLESESAGLLPHRGLSDRTQAPGEVGAGAGAGGCRCRWVQVGAGGCRCRWVQVGAGGCRCSVLCIETF